MIPTIYNAKCYIDASSQGKNGPIEEDKPQSEVRQEPFSLIKGFEWSNVDLNDEKEQQELYQLLNENYVEDDDNMFRFTIVLLMIMRMK